MSRENDLGANIPSSKGRDRSSLSSSSGTVNVGGAGAAAGDFGVRKRDNKELFDDDFASDDDGIGRWMSSENPRGGGRIKSMEVRCTSSHSSRSPSNSSSGMGARSAQASLVDSGALTGTARRADDADEACGNDEAEGRKIENRLSLNDRPRLS